MVDNTKFNTNLKYGVVDHFVDKKMVDNTKISNKRIENTKFIYVKLIFQSSQLWTFWA